jgi:hypothetical protein
MSAAMTVENDAPPPTRNSTDRKRARHMDLLSKFRHDTDVAIDSGHEVCPYQICVIFPSAPSSICCASRT